MIAPNARPLWNIPYQRNPFFTGREETLSQLYHALQAENVVALSHPQGITGLGGIGKTQTALEYAYRYRVEYDAVFWVRADSTIALASGFADLAYLLDLPERNEQDQSVIVEAVLRWLRTNTGWLLVFDNLDDLSVVKPFLPKAGPGHTLFTTRAHALSGIAQRMEVLKMEPEIGALLLLRRASILPLQATLDIAIKDDRSVACEISQQLDGLPLALDQAGAYIKETSCTLTDYVALYQTRRREILQARGSFDKDYPASVATTWSLSFEKIGQVNAAATDLLNFCTFMAPDAIPEETITVGTQHLTPSLQVVAAHPLQFDQTIVALLAYSLIDRNTNATLSIHRLVQAVLKDEMDEVTQREWAKRTVRVVNDFFPEVEFTSWSRCQQILPHAQACALLIVQYGFSFPGAARLLNHTGHYLHERAQYTESEVLLKRALTISEETLEPVHPFIAVCLNNLARLYRVQGEYQKAETLYRRAVAIREQALGAEHPDTGEILNNLGLLYYIWGKYSLAEPLYLRALAIREQVLGPNHHDTGESLNNLGLLYHDQSRFEEAEPLYQRALAIREQELGPDHLDIAQSLNNLAELCRDKGRYEQAEPLYRRALTIRERGLGPDHPDTAQSLDNLAQLYYAQGRYEQAEPLYQRALTIREQTRGPDHPDTATDLNGLANLYSAQGHYEQAEPLYQRALKIYEQVLGPEHLFTATCLNNLAKLYYSQSKYGEAEPLFLRALAICEQKLGPEHVHTAISLYRLALLYREQDRYADAEPLLLRSLAIRERKLGPQHPDTAKCLYDLAKLYFMQGRYGEAEPLYQRTLASCEQSLGTQHLDTAQCLNDLATLYYKQGRYAEVEQLYQRTLRIWEQTLGTDHPKTLDIRMRYATLLRETGRDEEAVILETSLPEHARAEQEKRRTQ